MWDSQLVTHLEEELHESQDSMKQVLASIQDTQSRMAEELTQVYICQQRSHYTETQVHLSVHVPPEPLHSTPEMKKSIIQRSPTYDNVDQESARHTRQSKSKPPNSMPWTYPTPRRRKAKKVTGTQESTDSFCGAPVVRSLFLSNVAKTTQVETVTKYIEARCDGLICVRQWSHPDAPLRSFKVTVKKERVKDLLNSDFPWPKNVQVRRFVPRRGPPPTHVQ